MLSFEAQKKKFLSLKAKNSIKAGSTAFLISAGWFNKWKRAVGIDSTAKEEKEDKKSSETIKIYPIDNRVLLINGRLKPTLTEKYDFIILSPPLWKLLYEWYPGEGPEIQVDIIDHPVEHVPVPILHNLTFSVFYSKSIDTKPNYTKSENCNPKDPNLNFIDVKVNKYQKIRDIKEKACEMLDIDPDKAVIRDFWNFNSLPALSDDEFIYNEHLVDTQELLLQIKDASSPMIQRKNRLVSRTNSSMTIGNAPMLSFKATTKGHVGLSNLGNTCFFNSAVQALSHTEMLVAFFMNAKWREYINSTNRFSTNGIITNAYAQIVNDIWLKDFPFITPKRLFDIISEYAPRFGDHNQHDAQELMMFLLDGLHEDLNKANKNVYIEGVEGDSSSEQVAAEAAWKRHKLTNDSIIVDLFHGQLESQLECPVCHCKKIVFDPYLCVTLPMPTERMNSIRYFYIPYDMKKMRHIVKIHVISSTEEENARNDAIQRFNIFSKETDNKNETSSNESNNDTNEHKDCLVIEKDDLISNYGVKLPPLLRKLDYIIFEIPDNRKLYALTSVHAEFQKKGISSIIDGPVLVEIPDTVFEDQEKIIKIINQPNIKSNKKSQKSKNKKKTQIAKQKQPSKKKTPTNKKKMAKSDSNTSSTMTTRSSMRTRSQTTTTTTKTRSAFSPSRTRVTRKKKQEEETVQILVKTRMQTRNRNQKNKKKVEEEEEQNEDYEQEEEEESTPEEEEDNNDEYDNISDNDKIISIFRSISEQMQKASEERFGIYWGDTVFTLIDSQRQLDLSISPRISQKLNDCLSDQNQKMFAEPVNINNYYENTNVSKVINTLRLANSDIFYFFEKSDDFQCFSSTSMKITLNPLFSKTSSGFKWQAVMPISKAISMPEDTTITLNKCLECFSYPDKLDELNEWFCPTCRKLVRAIARLDIWSLPDNLILHLKRFVYKNGCYKKVFGKINFPEIIDMQPFVRGPQKNDANLKYKVHAVINHIGTMAGGHYTTSAFSSSEDKWFTYNDEAVYQTSEKITYSDLPYVLFYHRMNDK